MREIVLDIETTGISFNDGDRIIEIGCIELFDNMPTGNSYHTYLNPEGKAVSESAFAVHNISNDFLLDKPKFSQIKESLLDFLQKDNIIAHNGNFDISFINYELGLCNLPILNNKLIDTYALAKKIFMGAACGLDALCKRFKVDKTKRKYHGALLDASILAKIYYFLKEKIGENDDLFQEEKKQSEFFDFKNRENFINFLWDENITDHNKILEKIKSESW